MLTFNHSMIVLTIVILIGFIQSTSALPSLRNDVSISTNEVLKYAPKIVLTASRTKIPSSKPSTKKTSSPSLKPISKVTANVNPTVSPTFSSTSSTYKTGKSVSYSQTGGYATMNLAIPNVSLAQCKAQCDGTE